MDRGWNCRLKEWKIGGKMVRMMEGDLGRKQGGEKQMTSIESKHHTASPNASSF